VRGPVVIAMVGIRDRHRGLVALLNVQLAFTQGGAKAEVCLKRGRRLRPTSAPGSYQIQLALKTNRKLLVRPVASLGVILRNEDIGFFSRSMGGVDTRKGFRHRCYFGVDRRLCMAIPYAADKE
jgi:hypothetical protein